MAAVALIGIISPDHTHKTSTPTAALAVLVATAAQDRVTHKQTRTALVALVAAHRPGQTPERVALVERAVTAERGAMAAVTAQQAIQAAAVTYLAVALVLVVLLAALLERLSQVRQEPFRTMAR